MIKSLFVFRWKQFYKILDGLGAGYVLLFIPLMALPFLMVRKYASIQDSAILLVLGLCSLFLLIHQRRSDIRFLNIITDNTYKVFIIEYSLLSLPILFGLIYFQQWISIALLFAIISIIPFAKKFTYKSGITEFAIKFIPPHHYEWRTGLRKAFFILLLFYLITIVLSFLPFLSIFLSWFFLIAISGFFMHNEPTNILESHEMGPKALLKHKIWSNSKITLLSFLPTLGIYLIFNPLHWWAGALFFVLIPLYFAYIFILKYSYYSPCEASMASQTYLTIGIIGIFIPFLLPLPFIIGFKRYFIALEKLNFYLDDFS